MRGDGEGFKQQGERRHKAPLRARQSQIRQRVAGAYSHFSAPLDARPSQLAQTNRQFMAVRLIQSGLLAAILFATGSHAIAAAPTDAAVKKSRAGICHELGTAGYEQTVHFKPFGSLAACLKSGGRLPKTVSRKKSHFDPSKPAHAGDEGVLYGPLVRVIDGDTVIVKIQGAALHIRLIGIDAPELDQPFGIDARNALVELIGEQQCVLVYDEGDMYGRLVAHLWIGDTYVNAQMVQRGMAWFDTVSAPDNLLDLYQEEARDAKRGLWALPLEERVPPWEWRKEQR
jgi:endonuclease YncB( thermonuclease family)